MRASLVLLVSAFAAVALVLAFAPPASATPDVPVCVGYDMCQPCHEGYAWIGYEVKGTWTCGQCEACGNPIW